MDAKEIATHLDEIAMLLELKGENPFKVRAYSHAARLLENSEISVEDFLEKAKMGEMKGVGDALIEAIESFHMKGSFPFLKHLQSEFPAELLELFQIPGLGGKKVKVLHSELGIDSIKKLQAACEKNEIASLKGFGKKTQQNILQGLERLSAYRGRFLISQALSEARVLVEALQRSGLALKVEIAGSIRRRKEIIRDIDILASSKLPENLMSIFLSHPHVAMITAQGETKSSVVLRSGMAADLRVVEDHQFAPALMYFTGSKEHNTALRALAQKKDLKLNEYGLFRGTQALDAATEEALYHELDLCFIPAELRENLGEIELARETFRGKGTFPNLVTSKDIQGVLHCHTTYSDGSNTLRQLAEAVKKMGYQYIGVSDHSQSAAYARGLKPDDIKRQHEEIERLNDELEPFRIFKGVESDILADGALDYDDKTLETFDFVITSVHSRFAMDEKTMTKRIIQAVKNPYTTILGHISGRLLLKRESYPVDIPAVLEAAAEAGVAVELNADPWRLELDWRYLKRAKELGIRVPISPDAHSIEGVHHLEYGVGIARKGWLTKEDVLNCWDVSRIETFFRKHPRSLSR